MNNKEKDIITPYGKGLEPEIDPITLYGKGLESKIDPITPYGKGETYYTWDGKKVSSIDEVMEYNQLYYERMKIRPDFSIIQNNEESIERHR